MVCVYRENQLMLTCDTREGTVSSAQSSTVVCIFKTKTLEFQCPPLLVLVDKRFCRTCDDTRVDRKLEGALDGFGLGDNLGVLQGYQVCFLCSAFWSIEATKGADGIWGITPTPLVAAENYRAPDKDAQKYLGVSL